MFESDQHDFDDEYEELSHPAPPFPAAKQAAAEPVPNGKPSTSSIAQQPSASTTSARPSVAAGSATTSLSASVAVAEPMVEDEENEEELDEFEPQYKGIA